jgi:cell division protein FtsB
LCETPQTPAKELGMENASETRGLRGLDAIVTLLFLFGVANFGWHAIQGEYGVYALIQVKADASALEQELAALRAERAHLENLSARLSPDYLDLDLLDERARAVLGHMRADEITLR